MSIVLSVLFCKVWYYISHYEGNKALVCNAAQKTTPSKHPTTRMHVVVHVVTHGSARGEHEDIL